MRFTLPSGLPSPALAALVPVLALAACAAAVPDPAPGEAPATSAPDSVAYAEAVARHLEDAGLVPGRVAVVSGEAWQEAARSASTLAGALARAGLPEVRVEPRGASFCARSPASTDCMFVRVVGPGPEGPSVAEVTPDQVVAVGLGEPAPPEDAGNRMLWREELRTGRLLLFFVGWSGG